MAKKLEDADRSERYIIFIPKGGLNDSLCQLERCWAYAEKFGRQLVVDTRVQTVTGATLAMLEPRPEQSSMLRRSKHSGKTVPIWVRQEASNSATADQASTDNPATYDFLDLASARVAHNPDLSTDHPETVLVHEQAGGGYSAWNCLYRLRVRPDHQESMAKLLPDLPDKFEGVHIRGTDYSPLTSEIVSTLNNPRATLPLLVCSDSNEILANAEEMFSHRTVITFSPHPVDADTPLHAHGSFATKSERDSAATRLLAELAALSRAKKFYFGTVVSPYVEAKQHVSGLSTLLIYLVAHRRLSQDFFGGNRDSLERNTFSRAQLVAKDYTNFRFWWGLRKNAALQKAGRLIRPLLTG